MTMMMMIPRMRGNAARQVHAPTLLVFVKVQLCQLLCSERIASHRVHVAVLFQPRNDGQDWTGEGKK